MRTILVTVGTSLLTNALRDLRKEKLSTHDIAKYLHDTPPERASAETNSLSRILQKGDRLVFLSSQTEEGKFCAEALRRHYEQQEYQTEILEIPDLTYKESRFKMRGLRSLVATLIDCIRRERQAQREVLINATGGFKAEIAYATLVGLLFDVPIYYIHEAFRDIIQMPPTAIGWDYSLIAEYEEFFEWLSEDLRPTNEVDSRLQRLPRREEIHLLFVEEEGYTFLSPAGEAFYEAYKTRLDQAQGTPLFLSEKAWRTYEQATPDIKALFDRALRKLRIKELRISGSDRVANCDCLVFPKGHRDERVFYFEEKGYLYVCELTRHSDKSYEKAIKEGVNSSDYKNKNWMQYP
jgi:putative CRISPR-associated protein (TIGR02619 family)